MPGKRQVQRLRGPWFSLLAWLVLLSSGTLTALLLCELLIMRFVLTPSDMPALDLVEGVIKYHPDERGIFRRRNEVEAPFRINAQGSNSGHADYAATPATGRARVLMIGDSYI